eukprot:1740010-Prymnesium_polylepis.1
MQSAVAGRTYATYGRNRLGPPIFDQYSQIFDNIRQIFANIREHSRTLVPIFANIGRAPTRIFASIRKSSRIFANVQAISTVRR